MNKRANDTVVINCACSCSIEKVGEGFDTVVWNIALLQRAWS